VIWLAVMMCVAGAVLFFRSNYIVHARRAQLQQLVRAETELAVKALPHSFVSSCKEFEITHCCQPLQSLWLFRHHRTHMRNVQRLYNAHLILQSSRTKRPVNTGITYKQV